ncbi:MAG: efflux RND transporter periplasmic adaptor subunit [Acidobacteriota bacterium]
MSDYAASTDDPNVDSIADSTPQPSRSKQILRIVLPILVLAAGAGAAAALILSRTPPERQERPALGPLVEAIAVQPTDLVVHVEGQAEIGARTRVEVLPEVSGRVVAVHPALVAGGRIRADEALVTIDPRDYELAVESARATIAGVDTRLEQERAEAEAARLEWTEVHADTPPPTLLVREPQIRQLEAEKAAAAAQLARAELDLERTRLKLPFDAVVSTESVDPGQFVTQGRAIATVYGTAAVEARVPLDDAELRWFDLPSGRADGPNATVRADFAGRRHAWPATVDRLEGEVDPRTRMVHVVVRVDDPFSTAAGRPPLLPGTFVDIEIEGRQLDGVFELPRHTLRSGDVLWLVEDGVLRFRTVEVLRKNRRTVTLAGQLTPGALVVTSYLDGAVDGMPVRVSATTTPTSVDPAPTSDDAAAIAIEGGA